MFFSVRTERLELSQVALPDPKSGASAISPRPLNGSTNIRGVGVNRRRCLAIQALCMDSGHRGTDRRTGIDAEGVM